MPAWTSGKALPIPEKSKTKPVRKRSQTVGTLGDLECPQGLLIGESVPLQPSFSKGLWKVPLRTVVHQRTNLSRDTPVQAEPGPQRGSSSVPLGAAAMQRWSQRRLG